jgi:predicted phosphodiesterase
MKKGEESKYFKYNDDIVNLWNEGEQENFSEIARLLIDKYKLSGTVNSVRIYVQAYIRENFQDKEIIQENVKLSKQKQRAQDQNRIANKSFREYARVENAVAEYNKELVDVIKKEGLKIKTIKHRSSSKAPAMIVHLSDLHLNELVDLPSNKYDFYIASKRLKLFAEDAIKIGKAYGVSNVVLVDTGDNLNSSRRLDEILSMATNRAKATQISIILLEYFIIHLNKFFNIQCAFVTGNESRANQELGWSEILASDNYDFTIFNTLKLLFRNKPGIIFHDCGANEQIVTVNKKNILIIHGHQVSTGNVQKSIQELVGKYSNKGLQVDFVMFGHVHSAYLSDYFARGASLVGSNAYSEEALNFVSKASQNLHLFHQHNKIDSIKIDLQNVYDLEGYPLEADIDAYDPKSAGKVHKQDVIFKIVI